MSLRKHGLRIARINHAVGIHTAGFFLDVIVHRVDRLAGLDAVDIVPVKSVIGRRDIRIGSKIIAAAEQTKRLVHHRGHLALEGKAGRADLG